MSSLERARAAVGTRFRLHGRGGDDGIDCVGLAGLAYGVAVPRGYAMRSGDPRVVVAAAEAAGLARATEGLPGDLVLYRAGPGQLHLAIASEAGVIHADAQLRRVVERPGAPPWTELMRWREG
jgi:hypothetical protein